MLLVILEWREHYVEQDFYLSEVSEASLRKLKELFFT